MSQLATAALFVAMAMNGGVPEPNMEEEFDAALEIRFPLDHHYQRRRSLRAWLDPAKTLAERYGAEILPLLEDRLHSNDRAHQLALMTLSQLAEHHEKARDILVDAITFDRDGRRGVRTYIWTDALVALTYMPLDTARNTVHEIAPELVQAWPSHGTVRLLAAIGDQQTITLIEQLLETEELAPGVREALSNASERIRQRVAMPEPERSRRGHEELIFWQTLHDRPNFRAASTNYEWRAYWLARGGVELSASFLMEWLDPDRDIFRDGESRALAIAILGQQENEEAIPDLRELSAERGTVGQLAQRALRRLEAEGAAQE